MHRQLRRAGLMAAFVVGLYGSRRVVGDEPTKPTASASESNPAVPAPGHSVHGEPFNEGPRHAAYLMPGMGKVRFPVTTKNPSAQAFVDQGVAQLHSFLYFEAERSFRQAARLDPGCPMAYWGMAMANVNNARRAREFVKEARKRVNPASTSRREVLYIEALEAFYKDPKNPQANQQGLLHGLETIVQEFPDDIDARAWMVMVAWQAGAAGSRQALDIVLDTVLHAEPMHPGAHHYRIHLWDGVKPLRAERSAATFARAAPGIAHAWHMPGHTYTGLRRYADAAYQQEGSARVDHAYMIRDRVMPFEIHNYAHNNQWLCTTYSHIGRVRDAIAVARNLVEQPRDPQKNGPNDGGSPQRYGRLRWAEVLARYEMWDDLVDATLSGAIDWSDIPQERLERAYTLGLAYAARKDAPALAQQIEALRKLTIPAARPAQAELEGYELLARGEVGPAFERFAKAPAMRGEALARAHLAARNYGFAESVARKAVEQNPNQVPPMAALVEVLAACGKDQEAREAYTRLVPAARWADRDTPVFRRIETIVARWRKADKSWKPPALPASPSPGSDETPIERIDLTTLGPLAWSPFPAEPLEGTDTAGKKWSLQEHRGRQVLVIFFLGGKCAHCMQQLQEFGKESEALKKLGVDMVAVSTDDLEAARALKNNKEGVKFPMPFLPDPKLEVFRRFRAYDDFENQPLHGTFLIDARGDVRFQRISADPFLDVEFIRTEAARLNRLSKAK